MISFARVRESQNRVLEFLEEGSKTSGELRQLTGWYENWLLFVLGTLWANDDVKSIGRRHFTGPWELVQK